MRRSPVLVLLPIALCLFHSASGAANGGFTLSTIATFNGTNGSYSYGDLTTDAQGNVYGTTYAGGASNNGTVFKVAAGTHAFSTIATFNGTNGSNPYAGVTVDARGNLYGSTEVGGASNRGTVFEIAAGTNTVSTLASFSGANGSDAKGGVTVDSQGNLYGTTQLGGADGNGNVYKIAAGTNTVSTLASFSVPTGVQPFAGVARDAQGNLYGTTVNTGPGGLNAGGTVYKIAADTGTLSVLAAFDRLSPNITESSAAKETYAIGGAGSWRGE